MKRNIEPIASGAMRRGDRPEHRVPRVDRIPGVDEQVDHADRRHRQEHRLAHDGPEVKRRQAEELAPVGGAIE